MSIPVSCPTIGLAELAGVEGVFKTGWLGMGDRVHRFEEKLRSYLGTPHVVAVNTGTSALHLALAALSLRPGDEVILPSLTFVASAQAVVQAGGTPVFCEVDERTLNLSLEDVERRWTPRTRAVMPVHFTGATCDMDRLLEMAKPRSVVVVEDAAHAFGSLFRGRLIGSFGHLTCFSFDPIKIITCGEGGAVATANPEWAKIIERMRLLGIEGDSWMRYQNKRKWFYDVPSPGFRYHMSNINASIGLAQIDRLSEFIARRRAIVRRYDEAFQNLPFLRRLEHEVDTMAPFMYVVRVLGERRDALMAFLKDRGIDTGVHYIPNHLHSTFRSPGVSLPVTERLFGEIVTLPLFSHQTDEQVERVIAAVKAFSPS